MQLKFDANQPYQLDAIHAVTDLFDEQPHDEHGEPTFYDYKGNLIGGQPGCSRILLFGCVSFYV